MVQEMSEPGGAFHSDNFTSNEANFARWRRRSPSPVRMVARTSVLVRSRTFTTSRLSRPAIAVIFDIRRQAVMQHLLFKALFELSADRADFIARLFSLPKPEGITRGAAIDVIWQRVGQTPSTDRTRLDANVADVEARLKAHDFALSDEDKESLEYVYAAFFRLGPAITYAGDRAGLSTGNTNFMKLTAATDDAGVARSFLGTEDQFQFLKSLEARNLVVPIQADFAGPKSIRAVGDFLRAHQLVVSAFYISNVEQYLFHPQIGAAPGGMEINGGWRAFYDNLAALPANDASVLLRVPISSAQANVMVRRTLPDGTTETVRRDGIAFCPLKEFLAAVKAGKVTTQAHATACGR
jgi:hypothetical protein